MEDIEEIERQPSLTETTTSPTTIAELARLCVGSFQQCLDKAADVHPRELTLVENQSARFSVWTANIGVFASGRESLDHRLREAPDIQDAVGGLLEALELRAQICFGILDSLSVDVSEELLKAVDPDLDQVLEGISKEISLLHRFSNTVRRASKETHKKKAAESFQIQDDEGNDVEGFLEELFAHHVRDQYSKTSRTIQQRLAKTMLLRRKRILYRRSRYGKTPTRTQAEPTQPAVSKLRVRTRPEPILPLHTQTAPEKVIADDDRSAMRSTAVTATTLALDRFQKASTPSVVSVSKTVALSNHENLRFPPAPCGGLMRRYKKFKAQKDSELVLAAEGTLWDVKKRIGKTVSNPVDDAEAAHNEALRTNWEACLDAVGEVVCPFCFCTLPVSEAVEDKKWREHVKGDLDPYVCLFEECDSGDELYTHSRTWIKHMREHTLRWNCKSSEAQLGVLADRNARAAGTLFQTCPLCGIEEVSNMEDHIVGHMRNLAIKSLPSYEEDYGAPDDSESQQNSDPSATASSRSTLRSGFGSEGVSISGEWYGDEQDAMRNNTETTGNATETYSIRYAPREDTKDPEDDPILKAFRSAQDQVQKRWRNIGIDPDCAICHAQARYACDCEARALDISIRKAEMKKSDSLYNDVRLWVQSRSRDFVVRSFVQACSAEGTESPGEESRVQPKQESEAHTPDPYKRRHLSNHIEPPRSDDPSSAWHERLKRRLGGDPGESQKQVSSPRPLVPPTGDAIAQQVDVGRLWQKALQTFPEVLEYHFSLVDLTVPPDDDPIVRDPRLSSFSGPREKNEWSDHGTVDSDASKGKAST
ncbi:hypothetical protein LZ30DRAFT_764133 [Colletotrichum cereale]|nr:hypothetical protein LZ30DRAFT_764133 [Colletotrichum cereale]